MRMVWLVIVSVLQSVYTLPTSTSGHRSFDSSVCRHRFPLDSTIPAPVKLDTHHRSRRQATDKMRIQVFFDSSVKELPRDHRIVVENMVVPGAVQYWEDVLTVVNRGDTVRLNRKCENNQYFLTPGDTTQYCKERCVVTRCGEYLVPDSHLEGCHTCDSTGRNCIQESEPGRGVRGADFVLYITAVTTLQCLDSVGGEAETVAYAAHCQQEEGLDRPVAGHTNICPASISTAERSIRSLTSTLKHELLHALGFSSSLFAFFRDSLGRPRTPRGEDGRPPVNEELQVRQWSEDTIRSVNRDWLVRTGRMRRTVQVVVTPRVVQTVRDHFSCPTLEGAELEDQGGDGTALTHWEKRIFQNEAMTGTVHTAEPAYSQLTLALLEDSGWYLPDYSRAQPLAWGLGAGCDFATKSCLELTDRAKENGVGQEVFCDTLMADSERTYCTADRSAVGSCNLVQYNEPLPLVYQNFRSVEGVSDRDISKVGSSVTLADFCPYVQEFTWQGGGGVAGGEDPRGTRCDDRFNQPDSENNYAVEKFGGSARCFDQGGPWEQKSCTMIKQWTRFGSGCYNYYCMLGQLFIEVRDVTYACNYQGEKIPIQLKVNDWIHTGSVICPSCSSVCSSCYMEGLTSEDHYDKREDLGDCFVKARDEDPENLLLSFLEEFNFG